MKERPILFSGPMVRAILDGRKTQTRRVVKRGQVFSFCKGGDLNRDERSRINAGPFRWERDNPAHPSYEELLPLCPYGVPGDRLVLLSPWATTPDLDDRRPSQITAGALIWTAFDGQKPNWAGKTRVGRFMPARLRHHCKRADVVSVRVELLNEISEADAIAEGLSPHGTPDLSKPNLHGWMDYSGKRWSLGPGYHLSPIASFKSLWESINAAKHPWESNPFVWVVEFKRREAGHGG